MAEKKRQHSFSVFRFGFCEWLCCLACRDGYCQNLGKNKAKMATSLRKICKTVRRLGGCGECELESRCLWSEFQSSQSVCFLALKYFLCLPPWFTGSWGGSFLLLFWNVSLPTSETESSCCDRHVPGDLCFSGKRLYLVWKNRDPQRWKTKFFLSAVQSKKAKLSLRIFTCFFKGHINVEVLEQ